MKILYEDTTYKITLTAIDGDPSTCTFEVTCDRPDIVNITQDNEVLNEFNIGVGVLSKNNEFMKLAYKVTNDNDDTNTTYEYAILSKGNTNDELYYNKIETCMSFVYNEDYTDEDVLFKLLNVDGSGSELDADFLCGYSSSENSLPVSIPVSNVNGKLNSDWIYQPPDIESVLWDSDMHVIARSYILTIDATDPQGLDLVYELTCDDPTVSIVQRPSPNEHMFDITYEAYIENTNIRYTLSVINTHELSSTMLIDKVIIKSIQLQFPTINTIFWDDEIHIENNSYVMTIDATDPNGLDLTYEVTYDPPGVDPMVGITQRPFPNDHIFDMVYGEYEQNTNVSYEVTVSNTKNMANMINVNKRVYDTDISIDNITWAGYANWNDCFQYESNSYTMVINATDPQGLDITYEVECDDVSVGIVQQSAPNEHMFDITYGAYTGDANLTYTITVTNTEMSSEFEVKTKWVHDTNPVINNILWDNYSHEDNHSYVMNVDAYDPQSQNLIYNVICDDGTVNIVQRVSPNEHMFDITYGEYASDTNIEYTITVTNEDILTDIEIEPITVHNVIGDRGIFAGGWNNDSTFYNSIDYITISTEGNASGFGKLFTRESLVAISNGVNDKGLLAGGRNLSSYYNVIEYITISALGDAIDFGDLSGSRHRLSGTSNGFHNRGIFGGGNYFGELNFIDYISILTGGVADDFGDLSTAKRDLAATSNCILGRGIFAGGNGWSDYYNNIEYITISTTGNVTNFGDLSVALRALMATSSGTNNRGIFAGGQNSTNLYDEIEYITISSVGNSSNFGNLANMTYYGYATSNGAYNRGIFAGGEDSKGDALNAISYITINSLGDATDFGDLSVVRRGLAATSNN